MKTQLISMGLVAMLAFSLKTQAAAPEDTGPYVSAAKNDEAVETAARYLTNKVIHGRDEIMEPLALKRSDTGPDIPAPSTLSFYNQLETVQIINFKHVNVNSGALMLRAGPARTTAPIMNYQHYVSSIAIAGQELAWPPKADTGLGVQRQSGSSASSGI